jgi:hypothetical protein
VQCGLEEPPELLAFPPFAERTLFSIDRAGRVSPEKLPIAEAHEVLVEGLEGRLRSSSQRLAPIERLEEMIRELAVVPAFEDLLFAGAEVFRSERGRLVCEESEEPDLGDEIPLDVRVLGQLGFVIFHPRREPSLRMFPKIP